MQILILLISSTLAIVSINSPSGEGGGLSVEIHEHNYSCVSINSPSGEGGGVMSEPDRKLSVEVSINSPSGEGGGKVFYTSELELVQDCFH